MPQRQGLCVKSQQPDQILLGILLAALAIAAYDLARAVSLRFHHPLAQPVIVGAGVVILVLVSCGLDYETYRPVNDALTWPLGPATVALAVPVYNQRARLRAAALPSAFGVSVGCLTMIAAGLGLAVLGHLRPEVVGELAVKSVTAPIAVELARLHGDDPSLTTAFVIVTGALGAVLGPPAVSRCRITDPVARGIALGTTSQGLGTAALLEGETAGAMASLAMIAAALFTAVIAPVCVPWLLGTFAR